MKTPLNIVLLLFLALCCEAAFGQVSLERSVIATSGISSSSGSYHIQSTTGQLAVRSTTGPYQISEGFQQGNLMVTAVKDLEEHFPNSRIYPVPTADILHVETELQASSDKLQIQFSDLKGQVIPVPKTNTEPGKYRLDLSGLAQGTYLLQLIDQSTGKQKSWKVSKIN